MPVLRFVWRYWTLLPLPFAAMWLVRLAATLVDVVIPQASGWVIDAVAGAREPGAAFQALAWFLGLIALFQLLRHGNSFVLNRLAAVAMAAIVRDAFAKVQRFSADWHASAFAGATVRKITRGMWAFDTFTDVLFYGLVPALIVAVGVTVSLALRWPWLGLAAGLLSLAFAALSIALSVAWIGPASAAAQEFDSKISATLADSITGQSVVAAFAAERREDARLAEVVAGWKLRNMLSWDRGVWTALIQGLALLPVQALMIGAGIWLWSRGEATPGDVASLVSMQFLVSGYLREIGQHVRNMQKSINEMEDVVAFHAMALGVADVPHAQPLKVAKGEIVFDQVGFRYNGAGAPLYRDFSLRIAAGERVGLVGRSGSGKSTFVKLIQRLHDIDAGRILVDGQDIAKVTQESLRAAVGIVAQEPVLFHRSLAENIAYGRPQAASEEVAAAAELAHAGRFIADLARGYDTLVGERGVKLSGGERQRVAIARAILAATPILVFDEATSSLDSMSERLIREAIGRLSHGRTTIVIAHRLSTVQRLDRILVFDAGRIVEQGTHAELMARPDGAYRRLFETQADGAPAPLAMGA